VPARVGECADRFHRTTAGAIDGQQTGGRANSVRWLATRTVAVQRGGA
jgi:hypothetical protein